MKPKSILISAIAVATVGLSAGAVASPPDAQVRGKLGDHPAVTVAKAWNNRGIDTNTFIVGHPAVTAPIPATSKVKHVEDNLGALRGPVATEAQRKQIAAAI